MRPATGPPPGVGSAEATSSSSASKGRSVIARAGRVRLSTSASAAARRSPVEAVDPLCEPGERREVAVAAREPLRAVEHAERHRGLVGEHRQEVELGEREGGVLRAVEHGEDAECALVGRHERRGHQSLGDVGRLLGDVAREPRVAADVLEDDRLARREHPARDARPLRDAAAEQRVLALAGDRAKTSSCVAGSCRRIDEARAAKIARATPTTEASRPESSFTPSLPRCRR